MDNLNTGKWQSKENGVYEYIKSNNNYDKFIMIFPKNYVNLTKKIFEEYSKLVI